MASASSRWRTLFVAGIDGSYAEALLRYDISFAGDPSKRNISNLQLAPMLNINLPERWFVTLYPNTEIRINYGDPAPANPVASSYRSISWLGAT